MWYGQAGHSSGGAEGVGDDRIALLHHHAALDAGGECACQLDGQRVDQADLQEAGPGRRLGRVQVGDAGRDDAEPPIARLDAIER